MEVNMKVIKQTVKVGCDMPKCRNQAEYAITAETTAIWRRVNICSDCMNQLAREFTKLTTPASPINHIKKARSTQDSRIMENI